MSLQAIRAIHHRSQVATPKEEVKVKIRLARIHATIEASKVQKAPLMSSGTTIDMAMARDKMGVSLRSGDNGRPRGSIRGWTAKGKGNRNSIRRCGA